MIISVAQRAKWLIAIAGLLIALLSNAASGFQVDEGREKPPPPPTKDKQPNSGGKKANTPRLANMIIMAPTGCRIWINEVEIDITKPTLRLNQQIVKALYSPVHGEITLKGLRPGSYRLAARKQDFRDFSQVADVFLDKANVVIIALTPLPARLTVSPSTGGAEIELLNLDTGSSMGRYFNNLAQVEIVPGRYRVTTFKSGYRPSMREVTARAGESIYLEPLLEPLPTPTPTPIPTPRNIPMSFDIQKQDKFFILRLQGSSGDAARTVGSINVTLGGPARNSVSGNFNGLPCEVELIKLDNIVEGSIIEAPGPSNNWSAVVVRIRPKDEKRRPISFNINWISLARPPSIKRLGTSSPPTPSGVFVPAVATQKVQPNFPRGSAISGTVLVIVSIDTMGSVISAKALEGPYVYRRVSEDAARKWKFRPATRDGRSVASEQVIEFKFER